MARLSRITVPGVPHHVTQRGNRRQPVFIEDRDYEIYRDLMAERCAANGVECWAYCLMPNHVHLVLAPGKAEALARAVGEAHRRYAAYFNARARVTGHLFQGRFASAAMDDAHFLACVRYLAFNPVKAKLARKPADWRWSSAAAHLARRDDALVRVRPLLERAAEPRELFEAGPGADAGLFDLETKSVQGRPLGGEKFIRAVERKLKRGVMPGRRGPKPAAERG